MSILVCIVALPSALGSAVFGPVDVLGTANILANETLFRVSVRTPSRGPMITSSGLSLAVKPGLPRAQQHVVIVPGFGVTHGADAPRQVIERLSKHRRVCTWLRSQSAGGAIVAANCAGTFVLAEAGLLRGQRATTTWWLEQAFKARYPDVELDARALVAHAGDVVTAGAAMAHLDLALYVVDRFGSAKLARACAKVLVLDQGRRSQAAYAVSEFAKAQDDVVQRASALLRQRLSDPTSIATVAKDVGVTVRTLNRRFKHALGCTPLQFRTRVRIDEARRRLERSDQAVDAVARAVGYAETSAFYRAFTRAVAMSPRDYQRRFGVVQRPGSAPTGARGAASERNRRE